MFKNYLSSTLATSIMTEKYPWVSPDSIKITLAEEELIAKMFGAKEKGYARLSSISKLHFNTMFPDSELECFASPLNSHLDRFASLGSIDNIYGSVGDIFKYHITERVICAHPPNEASVVQMFMKKVLLQDKIDSLTLYLFVPDWPNLRELLGQSNLYVKRTQVYSLDVLSSQSIMMNGNPCKVDKPWVPQKGRVLLTFEFPPCSSVVPVKVDIQKTVPVQLSPNNASTSVVIEEIIECIANPIVLECIVEELEPCVTDEVFIEEQLIEILENSVVDDNVIVIEQSVENLENSASVDITSRLSNLLIDDYTPRGTPLTLTPASSSPSLDTIIEFSNLEELYEESEPVAGRIRSYDTLDYVSQIRLNITKLCGAFTDPGSIAKRGALLYKLLIEFCGRNLTVVGSKISDKRAELNEFISCYMPSFPDFLELDPMLQQDALDHASTLPLVYPSIDNSVETTTQLDSLYDAWIDYSVTAFDVIKLYSIWFPFSNSIINSFMCDVIESLSNVRRLPTVFSDEFSWFKEITFSDDHTNILLNGIPCNYHSDVDGIFFCTATMYDQDNLDILYSSYRNIFRTLVVVSLEIGVVNDIQGRYDLTATICRPFADSPAYYTYIIVCTDEMHMTTEFDLIDSNDMLHNEIGISYLGLSFDSFLLMELYDRMKHYTWMWYKNDLTLIFNSITKFMVYAHTNIVDSSTFGAKYLVIALQLLSKHKQSIEHALQFAISHPLLKRCGGAGVDLYLNDLPHSTKNLMFMVEYFNDELPMNDYLFINMLDRKKSRLGRKVSSRSFCTPCNGWSSDSSCSTPISSTVTKYNWTYHKNQFHCRDPVEQSKVLHDVYFYQRYVPALNKFIVLQILRVSTDSGWNLEYVDPNCMNTLLTMPGSFDGNESSYINSELAMLNFDSDPYSYFPNFRVERTAMRYDSFGIDTNPIVDIFDDNDKLKEFVSDVYEIGRCCWERNGETDTTVWTYEGMQEFGLINRYLDYSLRLCNLMGWSPKVVNAVPRYYFDVYREISKREYTLSGQRVNYHTARVELNDMTLFPCPGSNFVWNCRAAHLLSAGCTHAITSPSD